MAKFTYVELLQKRKQAALRGDRKQAKKYLQQAKELVKKGEVDEDEFLAGAYT
jgi:hypothetical protein